jgi:MFS family permease
VGAIPRERAHPRGPIVPPAPPNSLRRTRLLVTAFFWLDGFVFANWVVRVPAIKAHIGASSATLGLVLLAISAGALVTMVAAGALCSRFGSGPMTLASMLVEAAAVTLPGRVVSAAGLAGVLVVFGAGFGGLNVAMNAIAVEVTRRLQRPIMPSFHAAFSLGGLSGALVGGALAAALSATTQLTAVGLFAIAMTICWGVPLLRAPDLSRRARPPRPGDEADAGASSPPNPSTPLARGSWTLVAVLGVITLCSSYGEGAMADWGALHLRLNLHTSAGLAAAGYASFSLAMVLGRLSGSWLLHRAGRTAVLAGGALTAALGMLVAALAPVLVLVIGGFLLVGLGLANLFPATVGEAGAIGGPRGVAVASTIGYSGFLAGPPLIGVLAQHVGLSDALTSVSALAAVAAAVALVVHRIAPVEL